MRQTGRRGGLVAVSRALEQEGVVVSVRVDGVQREAYAGGIRYLGRLYGKYFVFSERP
jgi:hypothetical protein